MPGLKEVAKEAGVNPIKCGRCNKNSSTTKLLVDLFDAILRHIAAGETVQIPGFGTFRARMMKGRKIISPVLAAGAADYGDQLILRFHQSVVAKKKLKKYSEEAAKKGKQVKRTKKTKKAKGEVE